MIDYEGWLSFAGGGLNWEPDAFWESTFYELSCAYIGWCQANGTGRWAVRENGWSQVGIEEHRRQIDELKKRFGDMPPTKKKG